MAVFLHKEQVAGFESWFDLSCCQNIAEVEVLYTVALS